MASPTLTRRTVLTTAALATTALAMPFVHGAYAAGKLSCGFWDHWVPGANEPLAKLCREWADREKVDLTIDFITSQGDKLALTATAEAQARSGHDVLQMSDWYVAARADNLEPVDELVTSLIKEHGKLLLGSEYIGRQKGRWIAVPTGPNHGADAMRPHRPLQTVCRAGLDQNVPGWRTTGRCPRRSLDLGRVSCGG